MNDFLSVCRHLLVNNDVTSLHPLHWIFPLVQIKQKRDGEMRQERGLDATLMA